MVAVFLACTTFDPVLIISTSVLGAYGMMRGISLYAPGYYNEFTIAQMIKDGVITDVDPWYWAYIAFFFLSMVFGLTVQCKAYKAELIQKEKEKNQHPYMANTDVNASNRPNNQYTANLME